MKRWLIALLTICVGACSNKDAKLQQDTPQAVAATVIKLYEAKDDARWSQVVDPVLLNIEARKASCTRETMLDIQCTNELVASQGRRSSEQCKNKPPVSACLCAPQNSNAGPKIFVETSFHEALRGLRLRSKSCRITDAREALSFEDAKKVLPLSSITPMCSDVSPADVFGTATFTCDGDDYELVLRKGANGWRLFYFGVETWRRLVAQSLAAGSTKGAEQRDKDLNKDLK